jgi:hypothetical protein
MSEAQTQKYEVRTAPSITPGKYFRGANSLTNKTGMMSTAKLAARPYGVPFPLPFPECLIGQRDMIDEGRMHTDIPHKQGYSQSQERARNSDHIAMSEVRTGSSDQGLLT